MSLIAVAIVLVFVGILIAVITMFANIIRSLIRWGDWWEIPVPVGLLIAVVSMLAALALYETDGARGFYRRDAGPAASFQVCGSRWADVAARLGARDAKGE